MANDKYYEAPARRINLSKGKRFDIFRRDGFTCQYCGEQPPNVVLHVDHIMPVSRGGANDDMNLITSCADCNIGKGAKILTNPQKPDADLEWLEIQQEVAELNRYQQALQEKRFILDSIVESLQAVWQDYVNVDWVPASELLRRLITQYNAELVEKALTTVATKVAGGYLPSHGSAWVKYLYGTIKTMNKEQQDMN